MTTRISPLRSILLLITALILGLGVTACGEDGSQGPPGPDGPEGPEGPEGPPGESIADNGTSVETCVGCHGEGMVSPVGDITDLADPHYIDTDPQGPMEAAGIRQLNIDITDVDVSNSVVVIDFTVRDQDDDLYDLIFASDGRFTIAKLTDGPDVGDPTRWQSLIEDIEDPGGVGDGPGTLEKQADYERFTTNPLGFERVALGTFRYTSSFDPNSGDHPVAAGESMRVAIQLDAGDIPPGNGWCDFDADVDDPVSCAIGATKTRDIVQTTTCNTCHGPTSDTQLGIHGGSRTDVEYCVTCHNPGTTDANSGNTVDMTVMVHKIHAGSELTNGYKIWGFRSTLHDFSEIGFTKALDDCQVCHTGGGTEEEAWFRSASREACGSCHDNIDFDTANADHPVGTIGNSQCNRCHVDADVAISTDPVEIRNVHKGQQRNEEAGFYAGDFAPDDPNGFRIEDTDWNPATDELTIVFSVVRDGAFMDLENDPEWNGGGASRLAILVAWDSPDFTNEDSGSTPGLPISVSVLEDVPDEDQVPPGSDPLETRLTAAITDEADGTYSTVVELPGAASNSINVAMEGHPAATLDRTSGAPVYNQRIPVLNSFETISLSDRQQANLRDDVVDVQLCNGCHDSGGVGVSLHGNNRTGEIQVCVMCHTADTTDINRRPADPADTADGKVEEAIDFKRMIHQIHMGSDLEEGVVIWGFGFPGTEHDFSNVGFTGNMANCETCHFEGTYGAEDARARLATTIDTGADVADPSDDLNISQTASVCSSCHDSDVSKDHMLLHGASFHALDEDIH